MARYLVEYDVTNYGEDEIENDEGETVYEEYQDTWSDEVEVEAESEDEARQIVYDENDRLYDDFYIWNVTEIEED